MMTDDRIRDIWASLPGHTPDPVEFARVLLSELALDRPAAEPENNGQDERDADAFVIDRMGRMLAEIALIVKGPEEALRRHSYHDLPQKIAAVQLEVELLRQIGLYESDYVIAALVAAGHVPQEKVSEAYALAKKYAAPTPSAKQEPIYQVLDRDTDTWRDTDWMDYQSMSAEKRIVYAAPQSAPSAKQSPIGYVNIRALTQLANNRWAIINPHAEGDATHPVCAAPQSVMSDDSGGALDECVRVLKSVRLICNWPDMSEAIDHAIKAADAAIKAQSGEAG